MCLRYLGYYAILVILCYYLGYYAILLCYYLGYYNYAIFFKCYYLGNYANLPISFFGRESWYGLHAGALAALELLGLNPHSLIFDVTEVPCSDRFALILRKLQLIRSLNLMEPLSTWNVQLMIVSRQCLNNITLHHTITMKMCI